MKTKEEILQKIERIKLDNIQNEDRKQHFTEQKEMEKVEMYEIMIEKNNTNLEVLYWVMDME